MSTNAFAARLAEVGATIEAELDALIGFAPRDGERARPKRLLEAMRYAILGGGKRLRPFLVVETARAFGAEGDGARRVGAAIECLHCYSLIHDDLPAMDDDDLRRGRPTAHSTFDEATAILAGDALLTLAFEILAASATAADGGVRAALCAGLARASGLAGMVGGQTLDLAAERATAPLDGAAIAELQAMKTGALLSFSVQAGGLIAGAPDSARAPLETLRRRARRGVPDRRRPARRRGRRGDAGQARRQGRRPQQGDLCRRARAEGRARAARRARRRGDRGHRRDGLGR